MAYPLDGLPLRVARVAREHSAQLRDLSKRIEALEARADAADAPPPMPLPSWPYW